MAVNKNAVIRYNALDKCFSNQYKKFYINDLIEYCSEIITQHYGKAISVSRRQIFSDMDFMKSSAGYNAPIESIKDGKKVYYRYSESEFSISKNPLTPTELENIKEALETLNRMSNLPGFDWINSIQTKVSSQLHFNKENTQVISFEENEFLKGIEFLHLLYQYIINKQVINIHYKSFKSDYIDTFTISPYYLKQYNNRWFLFGLNHKVCKLQNLALDRIDSIEHSTKTDFIENSIDFQEYFEDIVGVSNNLDDNITVVKIKLTDHIIPYISSKPVHGSQIIKENILILRLKLNYELESLILSYGEHLTVLEPAEFRDKIKSRVDKMTYLD